MATTTTKKTTARQTRKPEPAVEPPQTEEKVKLTPKEIDVHQYIPVLSGVHGKLIYISPRTQERFVWEGFGDEQELELQELKNAKAASKKFYERNWFMFSDAYDWVIDYLGVRAFYKNAISVDNFDSIFEKKPAEIEKIINGLSDGQKRSVSYRARELIAEEKIDSMRVIETLEKCLGVELIER